MRISSAMFGDNYIPQLNQLQASQNQLENQASTGLSVSLPEDDPSTMAQALSLQSASTANTQYQKNIAQLQSQAANASTPINPSSPSLPKPASWPSTPGNVGSDMSADANSVEKAILTTFSVSPIPPTPAANTFSAVPILTRLHTSPPTIPAAPSPASLIRGIPRFPAVRLPQMSPSPLPSSAPTPPAQALKAF